MSNHLEGLDLVELIGLLTRVPEPEPVSWMPQTAGWIWLGFGVSAALIWGTLRFVRQRRANLYRRAGLAALSGVGEDPEQIARVLRRTALAGFPRDAAAGLTGEDWLQFLDSTMRGNGFVDGPGRALASAPYRPTKALPGLADLARRWIKNHVVPPPQRQARPS